MENLLNGLRDSFQNYQGNVIKLFQEATAPWNRLFDSNTNPDICRGIFYIINKFLKGNKTQLFIQLPTDELGQNDESQKKNRLEIQETITDCLFLATKDSWIKHCNCPNIEEAKIGDFCYFDDYMWEIVASNDGSPRPKCLDPKGKFKPTTPKARKRYHESQKSCIRLISNPEKLSEVQKLAEKINFYRTLDATYNAEQCILIGAKHFQQNPLVSCGNIHTPVRFATNYALFVDVPCDILVLLWDRKYRNFEIQINNLIASKAVKKVIYLGTEIFDGFKENSSNMSFSFTYREIFSYYYYPARRIENRFPRIEFKKVSFPALDEKVKEINSCIPDEFSRKDRQRILGLALRPFLGRIFEAPNTDVLREILYDYDALSNDAIDNIVRYVENFKCSGQTPKAKALAGQNKAWRHPFFYLDPKSSYKRSLSNHLSETNNNNQTYIIDAPLNVYKVVDCVKALLSRGALGNYIILSYFELPKLKEFFESEIKVYNNSDRTELLGIKFDSKIEQIETKSSNLLDYYNDDFTDDILSCGNEHRQNIQNLKFECKFENTNENVFLENGLVIYFSNTIKVEDIENNKADYLPCKITYYQKPDNFQKLMELYYPIPPDQSVEYYVNFWKVKLRDMLKIRYEGNLKLMHKDFKFLSLKELSRITRDTYRPMFTHKIDSIANVMARLKFISADEAICIKAAHDIVGEYSINGQRLKASLIEYQLNKKIDKFLQALLDNASKKGEEISADSILNQCMITQTLIDITKKK